MPLIAHLGARQLPRRIHACLVLLVGTDCAWHARAHHGALPPPPPSKGTTAATMSRGRRRASGSGTAARARACKPSARIASSRADPRPQSRCCNRSYSRARPSGGASSGSSLGPMGPSRRPGVPGSGVIRRSRAPSTPSSLARSICSRSQGMRTSRRAAPTARTSTANSPTPAPPERARPQKSYKSLVRCNAVNINTPYTERLTRFDIMIYFTCNLILKRVMCDCGVAAA